MAHAQKPNFVFRRKGRVHFNRRGASVQSTTGSRVARISGSNAGYTMFRGSVKGTGYPLHSPVFLHFPYRASPCATTFQLDSTAGQATDYNMAHAHFMLGTSGYKHTLRICNTYCFSPATIVARTRLGVTLSFLFF